MLNDLVARNLAWSQQRHADEPQYFTRLAALQAPEFFCIGCSDGRVPANVVAGLDPGEVFVHCNVANIVHSSDMRRVTLIALFIALAGPVWAQTAPSAREVAAYDGLFRAAHEGDVARIEHLASEGADVNARDSSGRTPVHVAAFASEDGALRALAEAGADMNALEHRAYDVVTIAAVADDPELMSLAIELGNNPGLVTSPYLGTALIAAAHLGHAEVVRRLIEAGAPLDHVNNLHWTAVMEAVVLGDGGPDHQAVLDALLSAGADRSLADRDGVTPLRHAEARGFAEMVRRLKKPD